jgi:hypothetical protein
MVIAGARLEAEGIAIDTRRQSPRRDRRRRGGHVAEVDGIVVHSEGVTEVATTP